MNTRPRRFARHAMTLVTWASLWAAPVLAQSPALAVASPSATASATATTTFAAQLPLKRDVADAAGSTTSQVTVWGTLVLALLASTAWLALRKKAGGAAFPWLAKQAPAGTAPPRVRARAALGPQASVQVIEWNGEELLLGCTAQSIAVLSRRPAESTQVSAEIREKV